MLPASFRTEVIRLGDDFLRMHALTVPSDVAAAILATGSRRLLVTLAGDTIRRALQTRIDGDDGARRHHVYLSADALRTYGLREGAMLPVTLALDPDPDRLDLPEEFAAALDLDPEAAARFHGFTPGRQRSIAHYVASAKRPETREKRALELATKLRTFTLYGDLLDRRKGDG